MKKLFTILLCVVVVIIISLICVTYTGEYAIADNKKQLENNIKLFINRPTVVTNNINIKQQINLDNKKYILFTMDGELGNAELTKGFNNKYKIEYTGDGTGSFKYRIYKTDKAKYLIIEGKNYNIKIDHVKILVDNKEYKINIPHKKYFLTYHEVPNETQTEIPDINSLKLYDKNNIDISNEMFKILFH